MNTEARTNPILYLVVPCYNEEEIIKDSMETLKKKLSSLTEQGIVHRDSRILFVDDGSRDNTLQLLTDAAKKDPVFIVVSLVSNCGHQNALLAGMMMSKKADIVISIDADLQQDIDAVEAFIECYRNGAEVVYGVRNDRNTDGFFKKLTASGYYGFMRAMGTSVIRNHADYRLVSSKVINALSGYGENNLFLRGLIPTLGFPSDTVYFDVKERTAGSSKYTLSKMIRLATDGITSFTTRPLRIISGMGLVVVLLSIVLSIISFVEWFQGKNVPGYTTLLLVILFLSGTILLSLGVIGEYIGKIYLESKNRPRYIIDSVIMKDACDED